MANDDTLIHRAQTGDEGAFADLMREHYPFVYAIITRMVKNSHDAEEVVQDTFLNAYRGLAQLEDATKFKSWLGEIAQNCGRNWLRKQRGDTVSIDEVNEQMLQTADSSDERLIQQEQRELIRRTMETLPQKDREIAQAYYLEGASYDELTSTHGLSYNAIAFRLSRAKQQLTKRLQYLLTGIFVSPATTLKKMYSGGLTTMKVGTAPKITVGIAALVALIFIGFVGVRRMNAPRVEERVYLSPWEDGTERLQSNPKDLAAQTDATQNTESSGTHPQAATVESAAGIESIDEFFIQVEETDATEFVIEEVAEPETDHSFATDTSTLLDDKGQSPEDVMYAYVEAVRNLDGNAMRPLVTEEVMHKDYSDTIPVKSIDELPAEILAEMPTETLEFLEMLTEVVRKSASRTEVVSSEYVGNEFHFRLKIPVPEMLGIPSVEAGDMPTAVPDRLLKMKIIDGVWRIYEHDYTN